MSYSEKTGRVLTINRKAEPDDLEAQVKALKELEKQPGFIAARRISRKKDSGIFTLFKRKLVHIMSFFSRNKRDSAGAVVTRKKRS